MQAELLFYLVRGTTETSCKYCHSRKNATVAKGETTLPLPKSESLQYWHITTTLYIVNRSSEPAAITAKILKTSKGINNNSKCLQNEI